MKKKAVEKNEQEELMKVLVYTIHHYFGSWQTIFGGVTDVRNPDLITYPIEGLLCTGVMTFLFRLGARRQIKYQLRENEPSQT